MPSRLHRLTRNAVILGLWFMCMFAGGGPVHVVVRLQGAIDPMRIDGVPAAADVTPRWAARRLMVNKHMWYTLSFLIMHDHVTLIPLAPVVSFW